MNYFAPLTLSIFMHLGLVLSFSNLFKIDLDSFSLYQLDPIPAYIIFEKAEKLQKKPNQINVSKVKALKVVNKTESIMLSEPSIAIREINEALEKPSIIEIDESYQTEISKYSFIIKKQIISQWRKPSQLSSDLKVEIRLTLVPTGEIINAKILKTSGNQIFDDSALRAISKVGTFENLQMPSSLFEKQFRQFILVFNPE